MESTEQYAPSRAVIHAVVRRSSSTSLGNIVHSVESSLSLTIAASNTSYVGVRESVFIRYAHYRGERYRYKRPTPVEGGDGRDR